MAGKAIATWNLGGVCVECSTVRTLLIDSDIEKLQYYKRYYMEMLAQNRPVAKCSKCGAYFDGFVLKPEYSSCSRKK